jgi:carboxypeptidase Taq
MADLAELKRRMGELKDLGSVVGLLTWDQETFMPRMAAEARSRQLSAMQSILHERLTDEALGDLLRAAAGQPLPEEDGAAVRNLLRDRERAVRVPASLVRELAERQSMGVEAWKEARSRSDFAAFAPHLQRLVELRRAQADAIGHGGERYDALLDGHEPGMKVARLEPLFAELERALVPIVEALTSAPPPRRLQVEGKRWPVEKQWPLTVSLLERMGFDLSRGRQDRSTHPFTDGLHPSDVRLTTRLFEDTPFPALFGTIHEGGHGLYEQNLPLEHARDAMGTAASMGLHESQSRLWENLVGRSLPFWRWFTPRLAEAFPAELAGASAEEVYAAVNRVERTPIRVDADEVTYNLHILLRFRLELALVRGDLAVNDLPGAWNEGMRRALGITPRSDAEGVLQDIHWAWGEIGYFPTYTLGNLWAAALFEKLSRDLDAPRLIAAGELTPIAGWLAENVHRHGHRWDAEEIVRRATGEGLGTGPFLAYLKGKYGPLYGVKLGS